jgi:hypothetical protein
VKSIWYLINLGAGSLVMAFEGQGDEAPQHAQDEAQRCADNTGMTHALAYGKVFFQAEGQAAPATPEPSGDIDLDTEAVVQDLQAENEAMRRVLLQSLMKVGALDQESMNAPWDAPTVLHFASLWLTDALPWARNRGTVRALHVAVDRLSRDLAEKLKLFEDLTVERGETLTELLTRADGLDEGLGEVQQWIDKGVLETCWYQGLTTRLEGMEKGLERLERSLSNLLAGKESK